MQLTSPQASPVRRFIPTGGPAYLPWLMGAVGLVIVGGIGLFAWQRFIAPPAAAPTGTIVPVARNTVSSTVSATGSVVATKQAKLVFNTTGKLKEILVGLGDTVKTGQPLARLVDDALQVKLQQAQSSLTTAQIRMDQLTEGATPEEIAAAQLAYEASVAKLADVQAGPTTQDVRTAEAGVASAQATFEAAQAKVAGLDGGPDVLAAQAQYDIATANVASAQAKLDQLNKPAPKDLADATTSLEQAKSSLLTAQSRLEQVKAGNVTSELAAAQVSYDTSVGNLSSAKAKLDQLKATSIIPVDLKAAESTLVTAKKTLDDKKQALKEANADLEYQQHNIEQLKTVATNCTSDCTNKNLAVDAAYSKLYAAEDKVKQLSGGGAELATAQAGYDSAKARYDQVVAIANIPADMIAAQTSYDSAVGNMNNAKLKLDQLKASQTTDLQSAQAAYDAAKASLNSVQLKQQALLNPSDVDRIAAETALSTAQANQIAAEVKLNALPTDLSGAQQSLTSSRANLASAQAKLADLRRGAKAADVSSAQSSVATAQSALATKTGSARVSDLALQRESVSQAELAVRQAQVDLEAATLVAPFDGVIATLAGNVGEQAPTANFITLIDPQEVRVDVTVDESDVAKLALGKTAVVTFDALPNRPYTGRVIAIAPSGTLSSGVVTYPVSLSIQPARPGAANAGGGNVVIRGQGPAGAGAIAGASPSASPSAAVSASPQPQGQQGGQGQQRGPGQAGGQAAAQPEITILPAGMTASTVITIEQKDNVVTVPNRAVQRQGREQFVNVVLPDGKTTERRVVTTGLVNDTNTEITEGLVEGESVMIAATTTRAPNVGGAGGLGGIPAGGGGAQFVTKP